ncbi:DEAD/DEAH box helicase family protein [Ferrimonas marina]|uniref:DEAD/DEAH box helicase family protein n=1 Tax=Ferrimonas marina TaxID=299255 RepID=UPI0013562FBD|nr:DEAD/DEAH box helicase family protein [Ferrimonas marina]
MAAALFDQAAFHFDSACFAGMPEVSLGRLRETIRVSGRCGDLGKMLPAFQAYIQQVAEFDEREAECPDYDPLVQPLHHEFSLLLAAALVSGNAQVYPDIVLYGVYWHHAQLVRTEAGRIADDTRAMVIRSLQLSQQEEFREAFEAYRTAAPEHLQGVELHHLPEALPGLLDSPSLNFKSAAPFKQVANGMCLKATVQRHCAEHSAHWHHNLLCSITRAMVVCADRAVSALSPAELSALVEQSGYPQMAQAIYDDGMGSGVLTPSIARYLGGFDQSQPRVQQQKKAAMALAYTDARICSAAPGVGKTKIALEAVRLRPRERGKVPLYWICPRKAVCEAVRHELLQQLPEAQIALLTGDEQTVTGPGGTVPLEEQAFDILVTTVDQMMADLLQHVRADRLISFLAASVVFDEFHEVITDPALLPFFWELVWLKTYQSDRDITLLSGTPAPVHLQFLGAYWSKPAHSVRCRRHSATKYQLDFARLNAAAVQDRIVREDCKDTAVFLNRAASVQAAYLGAIERGCHSALPFHASLSTSDRQRLLALLQANFGPTTSNQLFDRLISGPAGRAALNISRAKGLLEVAAPESTLQQFGRIARFGGAEFAPVTLFSDPDRAALPLPGESVEPIKDYSLSKQHSAHTALAFLMWMQLRAGSALDMDELSDLYLEFYRALLCSETSDVSAELARSQGLWITEGDALLWGVLSESLSGEPLTWPRQLKKRLGELAESDKQAGGAFIARDVLDRVKASLPAWHQRLKQALAWPAQAQGAVMADFLAFSAEIEERGLKACALAPRKYLVSNGQRQVSKINLRGRSVYCSAPLEHYKEDRLHQLGYLGQGTDCPAELVSVDEQRLARGRDFDEVCDRAKRHMAHVTPARLKRMRNRLTFGAAKIPVQKQMLVDARRPDAPLVLGLTEQHMEELGMAKPVGFRYVIVESNKESVPVGLVEV